MTTSVGSEEWVGIGQRIREAREAAHMSVRELARRVDVSASHVSQVERGLASFSVRSLYNVASVLGISLDSLFEDGQRALDGEVKPAAVAAAAAVDGDPLVGRMLVQRAGARPVIPLSGGLRWERLTPRPEVGAEFIEVVYAPNQVASAPTDLIRHSSREYGIVIEGSLTIQIGFDRTVLEPGDSVAFDSVTPHRFWNETAEEVRAIWFIWDQPQSGETAQGADDVPRHQSAREY